MSAGESSVAARYRDGFSECAQEVDRFLASVSGLGHDTRYRLMNHLAACIKQPPRRTPAAFSVPPLNPVGYAVQLPPSSSATLTTGRAGLPNSIPESTVHDVVSSSFDGRRRSVSVAAAPYNSAVFASFVTAPPAITGRLSACPLFPVDDQQSTAASLSTFRPIQSTIIDDRCSSADSEQLDAEMTGGDVDEDSDCHRLAATSREVVSGGRPLTEKNDNTDNIARGFLDAQRREAQGPDAAADQSMMMLMMAMRDDIKDEHVWRPW